MSRRRYRYDFEGIGDRYAGGFDPGGINTDKHSDHSDDHLDGGGDKHVDGHFDMHLLPPGTEVINPDPTIVQRINVLERRVRALEAFLARLTSRR